MPSAKLVSPQLVRRIVEREVRRLEEYRLKHIVKELGLGPGATREKVMHIYERMFLVELNIAELAIFDDDFNKWWYAVEFVNFYLGHELELVMLLATADMAKRFGARKILERVMDMMPRITQIVRGLRAREEDWRLMRAVEEANWRFSGDDVVEYIFEGARLGRVVEEKIKGNPLIDMRLTIQLPGFRAALTLSKRRAEEAEERGDREELWRLGAELGRQVVDAAWAIGGSTSEIEERAYTLAIIADLHAAYIKGFPTMREGLWYGVAEEIYMTLLGGR